MTFTWNYQRVSIPNRDTVGPTSSNPPRTCIDRIRRDECVTTTSTTYSDKEGFKQSAVDECACYKDKIILFYYMGNGIFIGLYSKAINRAIKEIERAG